MNNNYTSNLNLANNQYTHIDLPIAVDNYSSAPDKTVTYADFIKFREILNFGYGDVNQGGKRVTIGGSTAGDTWVDVLKQIETLFEALHQRIRALESGGITLTSIQWESTTASSIEGLSPVWPRIKCTWSDSSVTYVNVGDAGVDTPTTNITTSTAVGSYSGIKVTYNGLTTSNALTYTVTAKSITSIKWKTTTGSSDAGTTVNTSTVTNKITVTYDNNTTAEVDESSINVYTNTACTTAASSTWYDNAGTYYIKGIYSGKTTTNYITWTVNAVSVTYDYYFGTANESQIQSQSYINSLTENKSGKPTQLDIVEGYNILIVPRTWGLPTIKDPAGFDFSAYDCDELGITNPTNKLVFVYECSASGITLGTITAWTPVEDTPTISSIKWKTTTGSSTAGTTVNTSTVTNKITVTWSDGSSTEVDESSINVYTNTACTTAAPSTWYTNAGTYYIKGNYNNKTTTNYITWTVNQATVTYDYYFGQANENQIQSQSYINSLTENKSGKPTQLNLIEGYNILIVPNTWGSPTIKDPAGFDFSSYSCDELGITNPTNKLVFVYECSASGTTLGTITAWTPLS